MDDARRWWKEAVVYQVYPRSFFDTNGDGVGDLPGVTAKLDYLKDLGVDVIWLSPHFDSPNADNGYDIRDYRKVMTEFGTMADFDAMLAEIKARGMRLILDLVVNHTSDEHAWFVESRASRTSDKRDFYVWRDGVEGAPPNNFPSFFGGSAWERDEATGQYYLHYFAKKQPDLNWENPAVRADVHSLMRFWLDKGVSGFRMDVIPFISKPTGLRPLTTQELRAPQDVYADGPRVHEFLQELNREVLSRYDTMAVGEAFGVDFARAPHFTDARRGELSMIFHFDVVRLDRDGWRAKDWRLSELKAAIVEIDRASGEHGWSASFLSNHDNPRAVSHFGDEDPRWRATSAKALALLTFAQRATVFLYQGDELGMTNFPFERLDQFDDVEVHGVWRDLKVDGRVSEAEYISHLRRTGRDNARTPMQWSAASNGGFTTGEPWLAVNPNFREINAAAQVDDEDSVFAFHRRLIALRRSTPALVYGSYLDLDPAHEAVLACARRLEGETLVVIVNVGREPVDYVLPARVRLGRALIDNDPGAPLAVRDGRVALTPWRAAIFEATLD